MRLLTRHGFLRGPFSEPGAECDTSQLSGFFLDGVHNDQVVRHNNGLTKQLKLFPVQLHLVALRKTQMLQACAKNQVLLCHRDTCSEVWMVGEESEIRMAPTPVKRAIAHCVVASGLGGCPAGKDIALLGEAMNEGYVRHLP